MDGTLTLVERTAFLKSVDVLSSIPTEALAQLAARAAEIHCEPGEALFQEGESNRGSFLVVEGEIELRKGGATVRTLRERGVFGELFLEEDEPHRIGAVATRRAKLLNVHARDVLDAMVEFPEFGVATVRVLARRNHQLTEQVLELQASLEALKGTPRDAGDHGDSTARPPSARKPWRLPGRRNAREAAPRDRAS